MDTTYAMEFQAKRTEYVIRDKDEHYDMLMITKKQFYYDYWRC